MEESNKQCFENRGNIKNTNGHRIIELYRKGTHKMQKITREIHEKVLNNVETRIKMDERRKLQKKDCKQKDKMLQIIGFTSKTELRTTIRGKPTENKYVYNAEIL